ncbi:DUF4365 domain-containing protein [Marinifilum caeruleilacunae]|uniref:DUF4365 domain-containing protein n=1 Tax=Marinifilum caeruleilacunae TaxID=2499076 RepID=A0ABX1X2C5_9BACT|nr:DUF4365 domain-containing protein [Marinifilum caeruleilacunae]NOU62239.1 DUF4365 domain-containing protein [Marinifilum caeruleilacunae]
MRSRSHILEEESLFELKKILPNEWVIREKPKDYGVDVEIEVFSANGSYTGLVFWIQLKGTDSENTKDHKSIRLSVKKIRQLASYKLPVAIFRYNSLNKEFYFDWVIRHGYLSSSTRSKSFNIQFEPHHLWTDNSINQIITFLKRKNEFNKNNFSFPIKGFVNNINAPNKTYRILSGNISKKSSLVKIVRDRYSADIEINLLEKRIVLNMSGSFGSSIGFEKAENDNDILIFDAFNKALLLLLNQTEKDNELFKFIDDNNLLKDIIHHSGILQYLLPKLIASKTGKHFTEEIVDYVFKSGDPITQAALQAIVFLAGQKVISRDRVESYFQQVIKLCKETGENKSLATTYYNLGNYYRGIGDLVLALKYYNKAYKIETTYIQRGYYCRELAGILFDLSFYKLSAKFYELAKKLEPDNIFLLGILGDAEMYSGNYEKALNLFDDFLTKNKDAKHDKYEFSLKFTLLNAIVDSFEIKTQKRNSILCSKELKALSEEQLQDSKVLDRLLNIDALNPVVWNYYSFISIREQDLFLMFLSSLVQAILIKFESKLWASLSIQATLDELHYPLLNDIANTAYFYCKESYITELQEMIEWEIYKDFNGDEFLSHVESLIKDPKEYPNELRFWDDNGAKILEI